LFRTSDIVPIGGVRRLGGFTATSRAEFEGQEIIRGV
jgi:hypothetical protein